MKRNLVVAISAGIMICSLMLAGCAKDAPADDVSAEGNMPTEEETSAEGEVFMEDAATTDRGPYADEIATIAAASVGDIVYFGSYEQDNDLTNGTEPVAWYVLDKADGEAALLSVYLLDCQPYHEEREDITWEDCTLRSWLNGTFYNAAFSKEEQAAIVNADVVNEDNPFYCTEGGSDTADKVWLLSLGEIEKYFGIPMTPESSPAYNGTYNNLYEFAIYCYGQDSRVCAKPTAYAEARGTWSWTYSEKDAQTTLDNYGCDISYAVGSGWWWLRSPGDGSNIATGVSSAGYVSYYGGSIGPSGVRPALKVAY